MLDTVVDSLDILLMLTLPLSDASSNTQKAFIKNSVVFANIVRGF
jgi:hypothetical protein